MEIRESDNGVNWKRYVYTTYDLFEIFPAVWIEVFVSLCQVFSIGRC